MTNFSPKSLFLENSEMAKELQEHREDKWMKTAFAFTISEMAFNGSSEAEIIGAKKFITIFQNLWEKGVQPVKMPARTLDADNPIDKQKDKK